MNEQDGRDRRGRDGRHSALSASPTSRTARHCLASCSRWPTALLSAISTAQAGRRSGPSARSRCCYVVVILSVRITLGDKSGSRPAEHRPASPCLAVWMASATALWMTGDQAAWVIAITIPASWAIHIIFNGRDNLAGMLRAPGDLHGADDRLHAVRAWTHFPIWVAVAGEHLVRRHGRQHRGVRAVSRTAISSRCSARWPRPTPPRCGSNSPYAAPATAISRSISKP